MNHHNTHISYQRRDKAHRDHVDNGLASSHHDLVLPKLNPKQHREHLREKNQLNNDADNLFRLFKDQNTIDILRHKNINQFKHKNFDYRGQDIEEMLREIESQKQQIVKEMKIWTRVSQAAMKGEVKFGETDYSELHNCFYKWLLFIQQSYDTCHKIENSLPPPLLHQGHIAHSNNHYNEDIIRKSIHHATHSKIEKQQIRKLSLIIKDLNEEIQIAKVKRIDLEDKIQELDRLLAIQQKRNRDNQQRSKQVTKKIVDVIRQSQQFLQQLKNDIIQGKQMKNFIELIDKKQLELTGCKQLLK